MSDPESEGSIGYGLSHCAPSRLPGWHFRCIENRLVEAIAGSGFGIELICFGLNSVFMWVTVRSMIIKAPKPVVSRPSGLRASISGRSIYVALYTESVRWMN